MNGDYVTYFDSFEVEHILNKTENIIGNKNITKNIFRVQADDSIMCGHFWNGFSGFMLKGKRWLEHINLFSPSEYEKNDKIILKYFP